MYCLKCGKENPDIAKFCQYCGNPMTDQGNSTSQFKENITSYKDLEGLDKDINLYMSFQALEEGLAEYKRDNEIQYRNTLGNFRHIISMIVSEFINVYPSCKGLDEKGNYNIHATIKNIFSMGLIDEETRKLLSRINYLGNVGDHPHMKLEPYNTVKKTYDELLNYMQSFLSEGVPQPGRYNSSYSQTSQTQQTAQQYNTAPPQYNSGKSRRKGRKALVTVIVLLSVTLVITFWIIWSLQQNINSLRTRLNSAEQQLETVMVEEEQLEEQLEEQSVEQVEEGPENEDEPEEEQAGEDEIEEETAEESSSGITEEGHYSMGATWTVEGQWELTIDEVTPSDSYGNHVITIDYHYTNLGYESGSDGLYFSLTSSGTLVDADGIVASEAYISEMPYGMVYPEYATVGATWAAQAAYHVYSNGNTATLTISKKDGNHVERTAIFDLSW